MDVRRSYWLSAIETMRFLTGKRVSWAELHKWKSKPGNNDDWRLVSNWVTAVGKPTSYEEARDAFQKFYWGQDGKPGNVRKEKLVVTPKQIGRWARRFELNLFTGRTRQEFSYSFDRWPATRHFHMVITMDDVKRKKPHPDGLLKILGRRDPASALYVGITSTTLSRPAMRTCRSWLSCRAARTNMVNMRRDFVNLARRPFCRESWRSTIG